MIKKILCGLFLTFNANILFVMSDDVSKDTESLNAVSTGISQFSTDLYQNAAEQKENENLICSPLSAGLVLAMTAYGAKGKTESEMRQTLRMPDDTLSKNGYQKFIQVLRDVKKIDFRLANKIFSADFGVKDEFKELTSTYFGSGIESLDFSKKQEATQTINNWCANNTNDKITEIVSEDDLDGALMVLLNAVYFKGNWSNKFDPKLSKPGPFHVNGKEETQEVTMMNKNGKFNYGTVPNSNAKFIELPYESEGEADSTSMFIIRPDEVDGLKSVEGNLKNVNFKELHEAGAQTSVIFQMPKFKIESKINLKPILSKMGMSNMFDDTADFTGIADSPPLKIGKAIQKAFIEVNEKGSEAAAVTATIALMRSGRVQPPPVIFTIDRPFIYAIVHSKTNAVLFQGHITQPIYN